MRERYRVYGVNLARVRNASGNAGEPCYKGINAEIRGDDVGRFQRTDDNKGVRLNADFLTGFPQGACERILAFFPASAGEGYLAGVMAQVIAPFYKNDMQSGCI